VDRPSRAERPHPARVRLPLVEALDRLRTLAPPLTAVEPVAVESAVDRILGAPVVARASVPGAHSSAMDGIAVRSADVAAASSADPILLAGDGSGSAPPFQWVDTGNPMPPWADAVIMVESVEPAELRDGGFEEQARPTSVLVRAPARPWQHVRVVGEDVVAGEVLLPAFHRLRPQDLGLLLAAGVADVVVRRRPVVGILPTGDELVEPGDERLPGKTVESNSRMIAAWVREWGGEPHRLERVGDDLDAIEARLREAVRATDVVCVLAGSSAGSRDFTAQALARLGSVIAHGIELVPGRPTILASLDPAADSVAGGQACRARVAIGLPGYPVAAAMVCRELLEPLIAHLAGAPEPERATVRAVAAHAFEPRPGIEELVRVEVGDVGGRLVARSLARGAGALAALSQAGGLVRLRPGGDPVRAGEEVDVELLDRPSRVSTTLLATGLADPAIDALAAALARRGSPMRIAVRSTTGEAALAALCAGTASIAVVASSREACARESQEDLLALARDGLPARVFRLARRAGGLVVAPGNPLALRSVSDLASRGARGLPALRRGGVAACAPAIPSPGGRTAPAADAQSVDEIPPLAAAAGVATGLADHAWGTAWVARALGLDFVSLVEQDVRLVLRADLCAAGAGADLVAALGSTEYRAAAAALEGYDLHDSGDEVAGG
jgi:molybdopterin molybdotransferase/putative molybdopterin biosynthesis protein